MALKMAESHAKSQEKLNAATKWAGYMNVYECDEGEISPGFEVFSSVDVKTIDESAYISSRYSTLATQQID